MIKVGHLWWLVLSWRRIMLVLSRKVGDRIVVGEGATEVVFVVMEVRGGNVRIGIEAERSVNIRRGELPETGQ